MAPTDEGTANPQHDPARARQYARSKLVLDILRLALGFAFLLVFLLSGASDRLHGRFQNLTGNYYLQLSGYLIAFMAAYYVLFLGLDYYGGVVLERRYDLSNQTTAGWLARSGKEWLLSAVLVLIAFNLLYALIRHVPHYWWLVASIGWFVLILLLSKITPAVIVPLFYKLQPLPDRDLAARLRALGERCGVHIKQVFEIQLSKETKKANAAVVGLGKERRILIGDTLTDMCSHDEIEAVFAHELGHMALHHSWKLLGAGAAFSVLVFYLLHLFLDRSAAWLGFQGAADIAALPLLLLWVAVLGLLSRPLQAAWSRRFEKQADLFVFGRTERPEALASALDKLAGRNLADPDPHPLVEWLFYDHPPVPKRIAYLRAAAP